MTKEKIGKCHDCTAPQTEVNMLSRHILELQTDKGRLTDENRDLKETINKLREQIALRYDLEDKIRELEAQIEKMKCCYNCSKWYDGECEESPKSKTFFCADFKCDNWEIADD